MMRCFYCGVAASPSLKLTRDHVTPVSRGGTDEPGNIVPACVDCNSSKNRRTLEEHRVAEMFNQGECPVVFAGEAGRRTAPRDVLFLSSPPFVQGLIAATLIGLGHEARPWTAERPPETPRPPHVRKPGRRALRRVLHRQQQAGGAS